MKTSNAAPQRSARARWLRTLLPCTLGVLAMACSAADDSQLDDGLGEELELAVSCDGKCDGWDTITSLWADPSKLDLGDLLNVSAGFATDGLNDVLSASDYASLSFAPPKLYALDAIARNDLTLGNIDQLTTGLAVSFGERELTTQVNALRRQHLGASADRVYGECAFRINASAGHNWNIPTGGFDGQVSLGFDAGANLEARVVAPFASELSATGGAPLAAIKSSRGFVLPRSANDIRAMKPGEVVALRGSGRLGLNVGVGVPILIAQPVSYVSYNLVLSAGLRTQMSGQLDVQLVRLDGDEAVVDVGISRATVKSARIALTDGWGVQGLLKTSVTVGGISLDLGRLVEKALQKQMNARLSLFEARAEATDQEMRMSVGRLRFTLGAATPGSPAEKALAHAMRGDIRLAQALSNRGEPGVRAEFDLSRAGASSASYAGIDIFGMSFFRELEQSAGSVVVQTPGGVRTLLFDSLHRESGWFFSSHGYTRVGLSGLVYDPRAADALPTGEVNMFLQLEEGDEFMERDKLLDHLDAMIVSLAGRDALTAIEAPGNALERYVVQACPNSQAFDPCRSEVLDDPQVMAYREQGEAALSAKLGALEPAERELVMQCGKLRLTAQATLEPTAQFVGPQISVVADYRLDDGAVTSLMSRTDYEFKNAVVRFLEAAMVDRSDSVGTISADRAAIPGDEAGVLDAMAALFSDKANQYQRLAAVERAAVASLGEIGPRMLEIRYPVTTDGRADYENAAAQSLAQARAKTLTELYDGLYDLAKGLEPEAEQSVSYALLSLTPPEKIDLRLNVDMDLDDHAGQNFEHYREAGYAGFDLYARGNAVAPIDGGLFDVNALIKVN